MTSKTAPTRARWPTAWVVLLTSGLLLTAAWLVFKATGLQFLKTETHPVELTRVAAPKPTPADATPAERPRNLIIFVADGLGFAHLAAGRAAFHGIDGRATWDRLPVVGWHRPHPVDGLLIDSAAAATALATGHAAANGAVSVDAEGRPLETLFERATGLGYRTGLVTDSYIWDATPAAFATHAASRDEAALILDQLAAAEHDVLFGELEDVGEDEVPEWSETAALLAQHYTVFGPDPVTLEELTTAPANRPVAAIFAEEQVTDLDSSPTLPLLTRAGLVVMQRSRKPFVLLVESEELDSASHRRDLDRVLGGIEAIEAALAAVIDFAEADGNTLVLFTSDHETGGLAVSTTRGNLSLRALWSSSDHTASAVPLMALGPGAEMFAGSFATWELGRRLASLLAPVETLAARAP